MISGKMLRLVARYLASECTEEERLRVEIWKSASQKHRKIFEGLQSTWAMSITRKPVESKCRQALMRLRLKLKNLPPHDAKGENEKIRLYRITAQGKLNGKIASSISVRIAASLVVLVGLFYVASYVRKIVSDKKTMVRSSHARFKEVSTKDGQQATLRLTDGTQILLNSASKVRYTEDSSSSRLFYLEGEAYFEVVHSDVRPFVVRTRNAVINDVGTKFDVSSWPGDGQTQVAVTIGEVLVQPEKADAHLRLILARGQTATIRSDGSIDAPTNADLQRIVAWIDGKLIFHNEQMQNVLKELKRKYGLTCYASDPSVLTRTITAYFDRNQSAKEVLDIISLSLGMTYRASNDSVLFVPMESNSQPKTHY